MGENKQNKRTNRITILSEVFLSKVHKVSNSAGHTHVRLYTHKEVHAWTKDRGVCVHATQPIQPYIFHTVYCVLRKSNTEKCAISTEYLNVKPASHRFSFCWMSSFYSTFGGWLYGRTELRDTLLGSVLLSRFWLHYFVNVCTTLLQDCVHGNLRTNLTWTTSHDKKFFIPILNRWHFLGMLYVHTTAWNWSYHTNEDRVKSYLS